MTAVSGSVFAQAPEVIDPSTGDTVLISEIDIQSLNDAERRNLGAQLLSFLGVELGGRPDGAREVPNVEVVNPATGETENLSDINIRSLTRAERGDLREQLSEAGVELPSRRGRSQRGGGEVDTVNSGNQESALASASPANGGDANGGPAAGNSEGRGRDGAGDRGGRGARGGPGGRGNGGGRNGPPNS